MLKSGVLVKLLEDIKKSENIIEDERKPVLLQIRGIIPALEEGDLWVSRGFYLKVSDLSHSAYVSLPQEHNEIIFNNKLKLGQFIYVLNLEKSDPVPLIRGLTPVPGRRHWEGTPEDIVPQASLFKYLETSDSDSVVEKGVISEKKIIENTESFSRNLTRGMSDFDALIKKNDGLDHQPGARKTRSSSASRIRPEGLPKSIGSFSYDDSDCESTISSSGSSSYISKRKSWNESELLGLKEIYDSSFVKHEIRPHPPNCRRSRSETASPVRSTKYDSSDDNSSSIQRRRDNSCNKKVIRPCNRNKNIWPKSTPEQTLPPVLSCISEKKGTETAISWGSLSSSLVKLGKELVNQRGAAINAAADALQEACVAETMLNSLSAYSNVLVVEGDNVGPHVDNFFDLQDELAQTRSIVQSLQSLTNVSPFNTSETDTDGSAMEMKALERKKTTVKWIKSAIARDLSSCSTDTISTLAPLMVENQLIKKPNESKCGTVLEDEEAVEIDNQVEWSKGRTLSTVSDIETALQDECRKLFMGYVEKYLDEVEKKSSAMESDGELAGIMFKVKKVNDWLDLFIRKESKGRDWNKVVGLNDSSEIEAYERVRNKIYSILLKHVERTAMALENVKTSY